MSAVGDPGASAPEPSAFAAEVRSWLATHAGELEQFRHPRPWSIERTTEHERAFHRLLYDAGLARRGWPVEHGGLGGSPLLRAVLHEELSAAGYAVPESFVGLEVIAPTIIHFAPQLAAAHLPAKLRGEEEWCQGFSEPDSGSDLASLRTRAVVDGDAFRIDGQKIWTSNGQFSRWCVLLARTGTRESRHRGLTLFWVDLQSPGVEVRPIACASGRNELAEVFLDGVHVPAGRVIGGVGRGWDVVMFLMQFERGNFAWGRQSWLHTRLAAALDGDDTAGVRASAVGDAYLSLCALRERSLVTLRRLAEGQELGPESSVDKILLAAAEQAVFDAVRAARSPIFELSDEDEAALWRQHWQFSRIVTIYGGAGEVQRDLVAQRLLGMERSR